jgi:hypothetical protein
MMMSKMNIPTARGLGHLNSAMSMVLSTIAQFLSVLKNDRMTGISVPLLPPLSESLFPLDTKLGSSPEGQIVTSIHQNVTFQRALRGLAFLGLFPLKETCVTQSRD